MSGRSQGPFKANEDEATLTLAALSVQFDWTNESLMHKELTDCGYLHPPEQKFPAYAKLRRADITYS